jgi:hypothetical protein
MAIQEILRMGDPPAAPANRAAFDTQVSSWCRI